MTSPPLIYKIITASSWHDAQVAGMFCGAAIDIGDGYIHFSTAGQVKETAAKHFSGQRDLVLLAIDPAALPSSELKWEPSRGGALFPHLYGTLDIEAVRWAKPLPWNGAHHDFPELT
jgi:uncharacterized protein (DUF952 family)